MNWKRIKTFLIILFLIINIYLISTSSGISVVPTTTVTKFDKETIDKTVSLISKNYDVEIDVGIIPTQFVNLRNIDVTNLIFDDRFQESKYNLIQTESGFECDIKTNTYSYTEEIATNEIDVILLDFGITPQSYKLRFEKSDYGLVCHINEYVSEYPIFDGYIKAEFTSSHIRLNGNWYFPEQIEVKVYDTSERLNDITSVLLDYASEYGGSVDGKRSIKKIDYGYFVSYFNENIITKSASAIPSYMIENHEGVKCYYDAYSGNFLKQEE